MLRLGRRIVRFEHPAVMGILNVTPDSFYDGGRYLGKDQMVERAVQMVEDGADIIDIGAVSTRPGAKLLPPDEESERLVAAVTAVRQRLPQTPISVDTCFSLPAKAAVEAGADIVNDISGGAFDKEMFSTVAELGVPYVLMHNLTTPDRMQGCHVYTDIVQEVAYFFSERLDILRRLGVGDVIIDPGFGFSKSLDDNYDLFAGLGELRELFPTTPLLVAISRKSMIYKLLDTNPDEALTGTVALHAAALLAGAQMLRAHDVKQARQTIAVVEKLMKSQNNSTSGLCHS